VEREGGTHEIALIPEPEMPARFTLSLLALLDGLDMIGCDRAEAWQTIYKIAYDSIPQLRVRVLERLYEHGEELGTTKVIEEMPTASSRRALEDLAALKMVDRDTEGNEHRWALKDEIRDKLGTIKRAESIFSQKSHSLEPLSINVPDADQAFEGGFTHERHIERESERREFWEKPKAEEAGEVVEGVQAPCPYESHRGHEWQAGNRAICGICHPRPEGADPEAKGAGG
jgi:hypothetical protein